jgi:hypothetical protein
VAGAGVSFVAGFSDGGRFGIVGEPQAVNTIERESRKLIRSGVFLYMVPYSSQKKPWRVDVRSIHILHGRFCSNLSLDTTEGKA